MSSQTGRGDRFPARVRHRVSQDDSLWIESAHTWKTPGFFSPRFPHNLIGALKHLGVVRVVHVGWHLIFRCQREHTPISRCVSQSSEVQHHRETVGKHLHPAVRLALEGGSTGYPHPSMCQRADAVSPHKSLPGGLGLGERIRSAVAPAFRSSMSASPSLGRPERKVACCEKCSATLVALKKQALSLAVHHHFSYKVRELPADRSEHQGWAYFCNPPQKNKTWIKRVLKEQTFSIRLTLSPRIISIFFFLL